MGSAGRPDMAGPNGPLSCAVCDSSSPSSVAATPGLVMVTSSSNAAPSTVLRKAELPAGTRIPAPGGAGHLCISSPDSCAGPPA